MEKNVVDATKLYSEAKEESGLVYPTYEESKKRFEKASEKIKEFVIVPGDLDEHTPMETRIDYVKAFQELNNSYEALVTYDDYNDDIGKFEVIARTSTYSRRTSGCVQYHQRITSRKRGERFRINSRLFRY